MMLLAIRVDAPSMPAATQSSPVHVAKGGDATVVCLPETVP
jgi:hypothetical protein